MGSGEAACAKGEAVGLANGESGMIGGCDAGWFIQGKGEWLQRVWLQEVVGGNGELE